MLVLGAFVGISALGWLWNHAGEPGRMLMCIFATLAALGTFLGGVILRAGDMED
jgi:hypothetical protein